MTRASALTALVGVAALCAGCALGMAVMLRRAPREVSCSTAVCAARCP